jgi:hypothetical protein
VNAEERKKIKRAIESQVAWKNKAKERKKNIRLLQLKVRDLERSRKNWKEKFFNSKIEDKTDEIKKPTAISIKQAKIDRKKN